ncbi:DUF5131 family protein [bacterium]|nr:DUF5131 family protein [bacterium]
MALVKSSGNMYPWVSHTWNPLAGHCLHECQYCYVHRSPRISKLGKYEGPTRLIEKEFIPLVGRGKTIFVCSCTDLFGQWVKEDYIWEIVHHCKAYPFNTYLFQTKNPARFNDLIIKISKKSFISPFPYNTILGITLETNRFYSHISKAPPPEERVAEFSKISDFFEILIIKSLNLAGFLV